VRETWVIGKEAEVKRLAAQLISEAGVWARAF